MRHDVHTKFEQNLSVNWNISRMVQTCRHIGTCWYYEPNPVWRPTSSCPLGLRMRGGLKPCSIYTLRIICLGTEISALSKELSGNLYIFAYHTYTAWFRNLHIILTYLQIEFCPFIKQTTPLFPISSPLSAKNITGIHQTQQLSWLTLPCWISMAGFRSQRQS